jgi:hypothetical protein
MDPQAIKDWANNTAGTGGDVVEPAIEEEVEGGMEEELPIPLQEHGENLLAIADGVEKTLAGVEDKGDLEQKLSDLREFAEALKVKGEELAATADEEMGDEGDEEEVAEDVVA